MSDHLQCFSVHARPCLPNRAASSRSSSNRISDWATASADAPFVTSPVSPSSTASGRHPSCQPRPAGLSQTPRGRRCRGLRPRSRPCGSASACRTRHRPRSTAAARPTAWPGEDHVLRDPELDRQPHQLLAHRAVADQQQGRVGHRPLHQRQRTDQHVLALALDEPRDAHDHRPVPSPYISRTGVPSTDGLNASVSTPGVSCTIRAAAAGERALGDLGPGELPQVGQHVVGLADPVQQPPGARRLRPPDLVPVGRRHRPTNPGARLQRRSHQPQRRRGAEPHRVAAHVAGDRHRPPGDRGRRQHDRATGPGSPETPAPRRTRHHPAAARCARPPSTGPSAAPSRARTTRCRPPAAGSRW